MQQTLGLEFVIDARFLITSFEKMQKRERRGKKKKKRGKKRKRRKKKEKRVREKEKEKNLVLKSPTNFLFVFRVSLCRAFCSSAVSYQSPCWNTEHWHLVSKILVSPKDSYNLNHIHVNILLNSNVGRSLYLPNYFHQSKLFHFCIQEILPLLRTEFNSKAESVINNVKYTYNILC